MIPGWLLPFKLLTTVSSLEPRDIGGAAELVGAPLGRAFGGPSFDGIKVFGRPILLGEEGPGRCDVVGGLTDLAGEVGLPMPEGIGEDDLALAAGELGRARRDAASTDGLAGRGKPPMRAIPEAAGEPDLPLLAPNRDI